MSENIVNIKNDTLIDFNEEVASTFNVQKNQCVSIENNDINKDLDLTFFVQKSATLNLKLLLRKNGLNIKIHANLEQNSSFNVYFADFCNENIKLDSHVILLGNNSNSEFRFSSLTNKEISKNYNICFDHIGEKTNSILEGYGVCLDKSNLTVKGISHIEKESIKSNAKQKIKCILFDKESSAIADPILKIDCDDISASHACAIGSLNADHIFYLLSRGIDEKEAKKLITFGYLNPIKDYFSDKGKEAITSLIEGDL